MAIHSFLYIPTYPWLPDITHQPHQNVCRAYCLNRDLTGDCDLIFQTSPFAKDSQHVSSLPHEGRCGMDKKHTAFYRHTYMTPP